MCIPRRFTRILTLGAALALCASTVLAAEAPVTVSPASRAPAVAPAAQEAPAAETAQPMQGVPTIVVPAVTPLITAPSAPVAAPAADLLPTVKLKDEFYDQLFAAEKADAQKFGELKANYEILRIEQNALFSQAIRKNGLPQANEETQARWKAIGDVMRSEFAGKSFDEKLAMIKAETLRVAALRADPANEGRWNEIKAEIEKLPPGATPEDAARIADWLHGKQKEGRFGVVPMAWIPDFDPVSHANYLIAVKAILPASSGGASPASGAASTAAK